MNSFSRHRGKTALALSLHSPVPVTHMASSTCRRDDLCKVLKAFCVHRKEIGFSSVSTHTMK